MGQGDQWIAPRKRSEMQKIILAIAVVVLAVMAVASSAFAGVDRYQETTTTTKTQTVNERVSYPLWRPDGQRIATAYTKLTTTTKTG